MVALLMAGNALGVFLAIARRDRLIAEFPGLERWWPVYAACPFLSLVALGLAWRLLRVGVVSALVLGCVVLGIELIAAGLVTHVARIPIAIALLAFTAFQVRDRLR
ncbi:MAG: hypothetical protein IT459_18305 [Planctomycetes bacterium]|nr:hypothetical protein [Planctomycetota bacterium]